MSNILSCIYSFIVEAIATFRALGNREVGWLTVDRRTGQFKRERQSLWKKLKLLVLFNSFTEWVDKTHLLRLWTHEKSRSEG